MYARFLLFLLPIALLGLVSNAYAAIQIDPASIYLNDSGSYVPYKLTDTSGAINVLTKDGSYSFDKTSCSVSFYNKDNINGSPTIGSDTYSVLASQGNTGVWNPVSIINNAACNTSYTSNGNTFTITGTKSVTNAGVFQINYTKQPLKPLKLTFSATNNNPLWTNNHIGMRETLQVPQNIKLGNQTYDLSNYNGTVLDRTWITNHKSQLIRLTGDSYYDMGIGWNHAKNITVYWISGKAYLVIDYTYNTPILLPGQTITIDPSISKDTAGTLAANTLSGSVTVGSNPNRILIATVATEVGAGSAPTVTGVKYNGVAMTHLSGADGTTSGSFPSHIETWYLIAPATGTNTLTATLSAGATHDNIGYFSLYNVDQTTGIKSGNGTGATTGEVGINVTPTTAGSWTFAAEENVGTLTQSFSDTSDWTDTTSLESRGQHKTSPTIGSHNFMYFASGAVNDWVATGGEVLIGGAPPAPTLTHANTLNSTAIKLDWSTVPSVTGYVVYQASPYTGAYSLIANQTGTTLTVNSLTSGTQYGYKVASYNSSGTSSFSSIKSNYTYNIAATSPTISNILSNGARLSWTNPPSANLTGGFVIYTVTALGSNYTTTATTTNSTNHYDISTLQGNREYSAKLATRYGVGTNVSGLSANSTIVTFYTVPGQPTGLTLTQTSALHVHLSWTAAIDNGTIIGSKIERSNNGGASWTTVITNTGNSTTAYNTTVSTSGTYTYRVSTIKYGGTSIPSSNVSITVWDVFTVREYHADGITPVYGQAIQANSTSSNNRFALVSGMVSINGLSGLNNFTAWNSLINFIVGNQYNYNTTANSSLNMTTNDFNVDCPFTGTGNDVEVWTNGTNGHKITTFTTPTCFANDTLKWKTNFTPNGNNAGTFSTVVYVKILNATFLNNAPLKYNTTKVSTALSDPYIVSAPVTVGVGSGGGVKTFYWSMNLTISPGFIPVNFTVGHISVSGTNPVTAPIKFTATTINTTATAVTVTFPSIYTMAYNLHFGNEGNSTTLTGLPTTSPSLGLSASTITFRNPANDIVTIRAYDTGTNATASYILAQPNNSIPFVNQILAFKNGTFGTSAMIGGIDIVTLIILIVAMIGLNRANETVGAIMMVVIIGVCAYFGIIEWPTIMTAAIALVILVIVTTTKKLPWS